MDAFLFITILFWTLCKATQADQVATTISQVNITSENKNYSTGNLNLLTNKK